MKRDSRIHFLLYTEADCLKSYSYPLQICLIITLMRQMDSLHRQLRYGH